MRCFLLSFLVLAACSNAPETAPVESKPTAITTNSNGGEPPSSDPLLNLARCLVAQLDGEWLCQPSYPLVNDGAWCVKADDTQPTGYDESIKVTLNGCHATSTGQQCWIWGPVEGGQGKGWATVGAPLSEISYKGGQDYWCNLQTYEQTKRVH